MKATTFFSALATALFFFTSCSNDDSGEPNNNPTVTDGFTWTENGGGTEMTTTNAQFSTQYKTFMVKDANDVLLFEINLDGTTAATYTWGNGNALTYTAVNPWFIATSGSLVITSNTAGKVSGTFNGAATGGTTTSVEGTFTNVVVVP